MGLQNEEYWHQNILLHDVKTENQKIIRFVLDYSPIQF